MSSKTNALENEILDHYVKGTASAITVTGAAYVALFTAITDGEAASVTEAADGNYARVQATWGTVSGGSLSNSADIDFYGAGAAGSETVVGFGVYTASVGGTLLYYNTFSGGSKSLTAGDTLTIATGNLTLTES